MRAIFVPMYIIVDKYIKYWCKSDASSTCGLWTDSVRRLPIVRHSTALAMFDVTRILSQIEQGDPRAAEKLLPLVYDELRKLAASKLAQEKPGQTLSATALVHDAYIRLVDVEKAQNWDSRVTSFRPLPRQCDGFWLITPSARPLNAEVVTENDWTSTQSTWPSIRRRNRS